MAVTWKGTLKVNSAVSPVAVKVCRAVPPVTATPFWLRVASRVVGIVMPAAAVKEPLKDAW